MSSGGIAGYFGYEYQFYVSVLLLLRAYKQNPNEFIRLGVETEFGQDAELLFASTQNAEEKQLALLQASKHSSTQVQIKTKSQKYHWEVRDICDLLLKRDESGSLITVIDRLISNPNENFLFITDGVFNKQLAPLLANDLEAGERRFPNDKLNECLQSLKRADNVLQAKLNIDVLKRVFLSDRLKIQDAKLRIRDTLITDYRIPISNTKS